MGAETISNCQLAISNFRKRRRGAAPSPRCRAKHIIAAPVGRYLLPTPSVG